MQMGETLVWICPCMLKWAPEQGCELTSGCTQTHPTEGTLGQGPSSTLFFQISSFASLWPATSNNLLQLLLPTVCPSSAERRCFPCHHSNVFSGGRSCPVPFTLHSHSSTRDWLQPRQYNPRKTTCATEHTNINLRESTQDRPSFLQAELRQRVLRKQLQGKQHQPLPRGSRELPLPLTWGTGRTAPKPAQATAAGRVCKSFSYKAM